ncbi:MAG: 2-hydroxychromene-2-carboxylate isomerase [Paracoccaceae bacterium]|jgi:2-hydroxychromene-2-carboxylate isomerase|nr:2-hydroxychromene-2-carboxylate isomerase [Paracoccaceae bacterium]MDP7185387.1 2-hydroxychromene-2-carboxylate isomerase [Paracoccaceae bacterium]
MPHIDYYFSTISPFAYLAGTRMEEVAAKHGASVTYKPMDLIGLFSRTGGTAPADRHPSRQELRAQEIRRQAKKNAMPINLQPAFWPTNPAPSSYAIIAAQNAGGGDLGGLCQAILRACWAEEKDISQDDVIQSCLTAHGFDAGLTLSGMLTGAETYAANTEDAVSNGVFGSPFYIVDGTEKFWGQDRIADLDAYLGGAL